MIKLLSSFPLLERREQPEVIGGEVGTVDGWGKTCSSCSSKKSFTIFAL